MNYSLKASITTTNIAFHPLTEALLLMSKKELKDYLEQLVYYLYEQDLKFYCKQECIAVPTTKQSLFSLVMVLRDRYFNSRS